ncbi:MAG: class I SAM-dependent methyltransferase [Bacteroidota bacterium]
MHSPFVYGLFTKVIKTHNGTGSSTESIERERNNLKQNKHLVESASFGAASKVNSPEKTPISKIARHGITDKRYANILLNMANYLGAKKIFELGTSLGITTAYLAKADNAQITTFEGNEELADLAQVFFDRQGLSNIDIVRGNINISLPRILDNTDRIDMVYFDANHQYDPTLNYFNQCLRKAHKDSIFVFDDIYWSKEMKKAWQDIKEHYEVTVSIDLYKLGIVFLNPEFSKQNYILEYW